MINTKLYSDFCFLKINRNKYRYTDNRIGSPYHYFAYMQKGTSRIVTKGKTIYIKEGDLFYIPKNISYQSYWYGDDEISFFSYGCNNLLASDANYLDLQVVKCPPETALELISIPTCGTNIHMKEIGSFYSTVGKLLPYMDKLTDATGNDILAKVKGYLAENPYCSNSQLADVCEISLPYLYKLFKNLENETPNTYRQKVICDKAKDILRTTDLSIEQISRILEFSSSGYFRSIFKKYTGMTPMEYRKRFSF